MAATVLNTAAQLDGKTLFVAEGTQAMTGTLDLGTIGKVKFPAAQSASADANTLDDYEEGTWTPRVTFGGASTGIAYATQLGWYTKVGQIVHFSLRLSLTSKGSSTGAAAITGLPFAAADQSSGVAGYWGAMAAAMYVVSWYNLSGSQLYIAGFSAATATVSLLNETHFTNTTDLIISGTYRATQ